MLVPIILLIVLIFLNATFASAEIAVLSVNSTKLKKMASEGNSKAKKLLKLTEQPAKFLATIQVAITLSGFLGSAFAADNFSEYLSDWIITLNPGINADIIKTVSVVLITLILSYFLLQPLRFTPNPTLISPPPAPISSFSPPSRSPFSL